MLKYNAYMIIGKILIDSLRENRNIVFDSEDIRRFNIGLLSERELSIRCKPLNNIFNKYRVLNRLGNLGIGRCICSLVSISDPYFMGYHLHDFIEKELEKKNNSNLGKLLSNDKTSDIEATLVDKYKIVLPEIMPIFVPSKKTDLSTFHSAEIKYKKYTNSKDTSSYSNNDMEELEKTFIIIAANFYKKRYARIGKPLREYLKIKKSVNKWSADNTKNEYYKKQWDLICNKAYDQSKEKETISNLNIYFDGVMNELDNILAQSNNMRKGWNKDEKRVIVTSAWITIMDAVAVAFNAMYDKNEYEIIRIFAVIFTILATVIAAINSAFSLLKNHHAHRETWLRHQLNYSRITAEIENFCECIGDYKINLSLENNNNNSDADNNANIDAANDNDAAIKNKCKENIQKFQENIAKLRKIDYENFFTNMDCINYNKEN